MIKSLMKMGFDIKSYIGIDEVMKFLVYKVIMKLFVFLKLVFVDMNNIR